ncbi:type II toxin-antitoxin system Phd/YefM family antitoxin, partial [Cellulomonas sp. ACRRI]|uniref:type II toxin-antitoxin system Phd/YefM family antitoxin n=1 Tax=Cellulomonas sp. ACRRI TaxID=2918188 RepID=UPI0035B42427
MTRAIDARAATRTAAGAAGAPAAVPGAPVPGAVPLADAASRLPELVHAVEHGDEVTLTRDGRPVARLVAVAGAARRTSGRGSAAGATVAANVSTTAIQLTPPDEAGAPAGDVATDVPVAPPAPVAAEPEPAAPTRVSTRPAEAAPDVPAPATTDATIVLDPVPAADPGPAPAAGTGSRT